MKRLSAVILALILAFASAPVAFAADDTTPPSDIPQVSDFPQPTTTPEFTQESVIPSELIVTPEPAPEQMGTPKPEVTAQIMEQGAQTMALTSGDYDYTVNPDGTTCTITGYNGAGGDVAIPETIDGKTVTEIGERAFYQNDTVKSVVIPNTVKNINYEAFAWCQYITRISIPESVENIEDRAFFLCRSLVSVTITKSVKNIGTDAFGACYSLDFINVDVQNTFYSSQDGVLFNYGKTILIKYPQDNMRTDYIMPNSVLEIASGAFSGSMYINNLTISENVVNIGNGTFAGCGFIKIIIPASVKSIGDDAFYDCLRLEDIDVNPANDYYSSLYGVLFDKDKTKIILYPINNKCAEYSIPDSVIEICDNSFRITFCLKKIYIPASVNNIGKDAFKISPALENINVDSGNANYTSIDGILFNKMRTKLLRYPPANENKNYIVPPPVSDIGEAFYYSKIKSISIYPGVTTIENGAFFNCFYLTKVDLPDTITKIGSTAFYRCYSLRKIKIPVNINYIAPEAFGSCRNLECACFWGNAPTIMDVDAFRRCLPDFIVYYKSGNSGFTNPWYGYPTKEFDPNAMCTIIFDTQNGSAVYQETGLFGTFAYTTFEPVKTGYSFAGWCTTPDCNTDIISFPYMFTDNETLYAKWIPNNYTVTYDSNGGNYIFPVTVSYYSNIQAPSEPTKYKNSFSGWYPTQTCDTTQIVFPYTVTENVTLYAKWTPDNCTISYDTRGGTYVPSVSAPYWSTISAPVEPTRYSYVFSGWSTNPSYGVDPVTFPFTVPGDITLYAIWTPDHCTVTYNTQGGNFIIPETTQKGSTVSAPSVPIKTGYSFSGWYPTQVCDTAQVVFPYTVTGDIIFYAKWSPVSYNIHYLLNGGTASNPVSYTIKDTITLNNPTRPGYDFSGWIGTWLLGPTMSVIIPVDSTGDRGYTAIWTFKSQSQPLSQTSFLSGVLLSSGSLSRPFSKTVYSYKISLGENEGGVTITPVKEFDGASMTINRQAATNFTVNPANGRSVSVKVLVSYGRSRHTYAFTVTRAKSTNNNLGSLSSTEGVWSEPFNPAVTNYTLELDENTRSTRITGAVAAPGLARASFKAINVSLLNGQTKALRLTVAAQSGARKIYAITVHRAASSNADLKIIKAGNKGCALSPAFSPAQQQYSIIMPANCASFVLYAQAAGYKAYVNMDGARRIAEKITLNRGESRTVHIIVTAQDTGTKEYTVDISRQ